MVAIYHPHKHGFGFLTMQPGRPDSAPESPLDIDPGGTIGMLFDCIAHEERQPR